MSLLEKLSIKNHEQVLFCYDRKTECKAIIAIHNTALGPALGGSRFVSYTSEEEALEDVLRLSRGMTFKSAVAGLRLGGGKSVIIGDHKKLRCRAFFHAFGSFVNSFGGRYITSVDMNTKPSDMDWIHEVTPYVVGGTEKSGGAGNPSNITALGVFEGLRGSVEYLWNQSDFRDIRVAVQGVGSVGAQLCYHLHHSGAELVVTDVRSENLKAMQEAYGATVVDPGDIHSADVDIFAPCAFGSILNEKTIPQIRAKLIGGGANNQLAQEDRDGQALADAGILYAPDYVMNSGGIVHVYHELKGYNEETVKAHTQQTIPKMLKNIFAKAKSENLLPHEASARIAEEIVDRAPHGPHPFHQTYSAQPWAADNKPSQHA